MIIKGNKEGNDVSKVRFKGHLLINNQNLIKQDMGINEDKVMAFPGDKDDKLPTEETSPLINTRGNGGIDEALDKIGIGFFHVILILVTGWALASDSVEILCIGFVSPQLADSNTNPDLALKPSSVYTHTHYAHTHTRTDM